ncbi:MAG: ATP-binding protein [Actinobacteria bacterium]|nr:ATP-binding protein [Actinomycetota bacterium]
MSFDRPIDAFVGRGPELALLDRALRRVKRTGHGTLMSLRGRRRVGKSRLVEEFIGRAGCPAIFYTAVQGPGAMELERFLDAVARSDAPAAEQVRAGATARTWEAALTLAVRDATRAKPLVLVLDELPYLTAKEPTIEAVLQLVWDRTFQRLPVMVLLVGSDRATMEALTQEGRPLYDRAREMVVRPLDPATVGDMLGLPPADALDAYAVIGGFPVLAREWGHGRSLRQYLDDALTDPSSFLVISAERSLAAEFPADLQARAVLSTIGAEARAHKALLARTGLPQSSLDRALRSLVEKGVVDRLVPYAAKPSPKNRQYVVADPYLRFWLRFVGPAADAIERGRGELAVADVARDWPSFRGRAIEPIVRAALERSLPDKRFGSARHVGGWWNRTSSAEVDLVGGDTLPQARTVAFVGSITWRDEQPFRRTDAGALAAHRAAVPGADADTLLLGVSRCGFEAEAHLDLRIGPDELLAAYRR